MAKKATSGSYNKLKVIYPTDDLMAEAFGVTRQNILNWKTNGIPAGRALEVEKKTKGKVTAMDVLKG